jgi:membrane protease subunit HflK
VVKEAEGEAQRFTSVYDQYVKAPDVTRKRLYLETIEQVLGGANKVVVDKSASGSGVVPYLPLPQLKGQAPAATTPATPPPAAGTTLTAPTTSTTGN